MIGGSLEISSGVDLAYRLYNSIITTLVWVTLFNYITNSTKSYQKRYIALFNQSLLGEAGHIGRSYLNENLASIEKSLKDIGSRTSRMAIPTELKLAAQQLNEQIDRKIRPLSQRLWLPATATIPKFKPFRLFKDSIWCLKYSRFAVALFLTLLSITNLNSLMAADEAVIRSVILGMAVYLISFAFDSFQVSKKINQMAWSTLHLTALGTIPVFAGDLFFSTSYFGQENPITLIVYISTPTVAICFSVLNLIQRDRNQLLELMAKDLSQVPEPAYERTQVASYLHNSLQSELLALSHKLEIAAHSDDKDYRREILEQLNALLSRSINEEFENFYQSPEHRLSQVISNWRGIIDIDIQGEELIFQQPLTSILVIQIIEELASNAAKHSNASKLTVICKLEQGFMSLKIIANDNYTIQSAAGFGNNFLDRLTSNWERVANEKNQTEINIKL